MNLDSMSREELIEYIHKMKSQRAFTYEDQLKLTILDKSPFTIWASDRNCIIHLWEGQCESMYGRKKEDVIGKDFVDLFVARDEQPAARRDQLEIIDNDKMYHNIANDQGRNGNTLHLITNCFRIQDPKSGEYWNAEMGVSIDYYEEEKRQLAENIAEGRLIQSCVSEFLDSQRQYREQFINRKESLLAAIRAGTIDAVKLNRGNEYREICGEIKEKIKAIEQRLNSVLSDYLKEMSKCTTHLACQNVRFNFIETYNSVLDDFGELVLEYEVICVEFNDKQNIIILKDSVMKETTAYNTRMANLAQEVWLRAEANIKEYSALGNKINPNSSRLCRLTELRDQVLTIKDKINVIADEIYGKINVSGSEAIILAIKNEMENSYSELLNRLNELKELVEAK